jgi:peptidoglycan/LPS O-acetylase OafA/YrhL
VILGAQAYALPSFLYAPIRGGYLAVTTSFVLSGFVLARAATPTRNGRAARCFVMGPDGSHASRRLVAAHGLLLQGWLGHVPVSWNTPACSLSCEIFFYRAFPLAAVFISGTNWINTLSSAAACCLTRTKDDPFGSVS